MTFLDALVPAPERITEAKPDRDAAEHVAHSFRKLCIAPSQKHPERDDDGEEEGYLNDPCHAVDMPEKPQEVKMTEAEAQDMAKMLYTRRLRYRVYQVGDEYRIAPITAYEIPEDVELIPADKPSRVGRMDTERLRQAILSLGLGLVVEPPISGSHAGT